MTISTPLPQGLESVGNSTDTILGSSAVFVGDSELNFYPDVLIQCFSDVAGTLFFEFSIDGVNWDSVFPPTGVRIKGGVSEFHTLVKGPRHFRIRYVNNSTAQSTFRLKTYYGNFRQGNLPLNSNISEDADSVVTRTVNEEEYSIGRINGSYLVQKVGLNADVDAAEDIWDGGGDFPGFSTATPETIEVVSDNANDTLTGTGARTIRLFYLNADDEMFDANGEPLFVDVDLNGATPVSSGVVGSFVWDYQIIASGSGRKNAGIITVRWDTTTSVIFGRMIAGDGVGKNSAFRVPAGYTAYLKTYLGSLLDNSSNQAEVAIKVTGNGTNTDKLTNEFHASTDSDTQRKPYGGIKYTEKTNIIFRATQINNTNGRLAVNYSLLLIRNPP